jgi:ribosomal protein S18 acetylase RimI-like enzyme
MLAPDALDSVPPGIVTRVFGSLSPNGRSVAADQIAKLERKVFPSNESFDYDIELKKKNVGVLLAYKEGTQDRVVAYLVYQRMKRLVWLHKLCVIEQERQKGIGKCLIHALQGQVEKSGGESIHLWVDEHRKPARRLYDACGFMQIEVRHDYYAPGRAGLKMELRIGT